MGLSGDICCDLINHVQVMCSARVSIKEKLLTDKIILSRERQHIFHVVQYEWCKSNSWNHRHRTSKWIFVPSMLVVEEWKTVL